MTDRFDQLRSDQNAEHGASSIDVVRPSFRCTSCDAAVPGAVAVGALGRPLERFDALLVVAAEVGRSLGRETPACGACGSATRLACSDYHAYHAGSGRDLVVRWRPKPSLLGREGTELLWWSRDGGHAPATLTDAEKQELLHDVSVRSLAVAGSDSPHDLVAAARALVRLYPADPAVLDFLIDLVRAGPDGVAAAEELGRAHLERSPRDADAHAKLGEALLQAIGEGALDPERLGDAGRHLERALELDPGSRPALVARANLLRLRGDLPAAKAAFERLLAVDPDNSAAHFNLGVMLLSGAEEQALAHFRRGEELAPGDVDFPRALAAALLALGRRAEARAALDRARELDPDDTKVQELEARLGELN